MRWKTQEIRFGLGSGPTPVVRTLLWINGLAYLFLLLVERRQLSLGAEGATYSQVIISLLGLVPRAVIHDWALWQPITYMFLHREFIHLLFNMAVLWWVGSSVEQRMGSRRFFRYYLFTGVGAALTATAVSWNSSVPTIGASGAIFGMLLALGMLDPDGMILVYFVIPVRTKYCVAGLAALQLALLLWLGNSGVNYVAHLGGMLFGLIWFGYSRSQFNLRDSFRQWQRRRLRRKLKLVRKGDGDEPPFDSYSNKTVH